MSLKKLLNALGLLLLSASLPLSASAQFDEGDNIVGLGIGVFGGYNVGWHGSAVSQSPSLNAHFDHGMGELGMGTWGLGGYVGYKSINYKDNYYYYGQNYAYDFHYSYFVLGLRGTWHYNEWHDDKWDTYGGLMLAYNDISSTDNSEYGPYGNPGFYSSESSGLGFSIFVGSRYYFNEKFAAFGELGYGISALQLGVSMKL